jgi:hypothetical protein
LLIRVPADSGVPFQGVDVLDTARINLPADSQTVISAKLLTQSSVAGRGCVTYVNSWPVVRDPVSVQYQVLTPSRPCPQARASPAYKGVRPGEERRARRSAGGEGRRGKAGAAAGMGVRADSD